MGNNLISILIEALKAAEMRQGCTDYTPYAEILLKQIIPIIKQADQKKIEVLEAEKKQKQMCIDDLTRQLKEGYKAVLKELAPTDKREATNGVCRICGSKANPRDVFINVSEKELVLEIKPWVELPQEREKDVQCPDCAGHGYIEHHDMSGERPTVADMYDDGRHPYMGRLTHTTVCKRCLGKKRIPLKKIKETDKCPWCSDGMKFNNSSRNQILVPCKRCEGTNQLKPELVYGSLRERVRYAMVVDIPLAITCKEMNYE